MVLEKSKFNQNSRLTFELNNELGESVQCYLEQPSIGRTDSCMTLFELLYKDFKNGGAEHPEMIFAKFDSLMRKARAKDDAIEENYKAWVQAMILTGKFIVIKGEHKGQVGELSAFIGDDDDVRHRFGVMVGFWYALLLFIGAMGLQKESELRAYYTALGLEDFKSAFLKSIEEMEAKLKKQENPID